MAPETELQNLYSPPKEIKIGNTNSTPASETKSEGIAKSKSRRSKFLLAFVGFLGLVGLAVWAIAKITTVNNVVHETELNYDFGPSCGNETICNIAAAEVLQALNTSVDPCDNFYEYACGGWISKNPVPEHQKMWMPFMGRIEERNKKLISILLEDVENESKAGTPLSMAKGFFRECMATQSNNDSARQNRERQFIREKLEEFGGWPILSTGKPWNSSRFDWIKTVIALQKDFEAYPLFVILPVQKANPSESYIQFASPFSTKLVAPVLAGKNLSVFETYKQNVVNIFHKLNISSGNGFLNKIYLNRVASVIAFTTKLFEVLDASYLTNDSLLEIDILPLESHQGKLNERNISVDLLQLLEEAYKGSGISVGKTELIAFPKNMTYFEKMFETVSELGREIMAIFLHFQMAEQLVSLSTLKNLQNPDNTKRSVLQEQDKKICFDKTAHFFFNALMPEYLESQGVGNITKVENMFQNIKGTFWNTAFGSRSLIAQQKSVSEKIRRTKFCISPTRTDLKSYYNGLHWNGTKSYMEQSINLNSWISNKHLGSTIVAKELGCPWSTIAAAARLVTNGPMHLDLDTGYFVSLGLQDFSMPFYHESLPRPLLYGRLGLALGHEIAHGVKNIEFNSMSCLRNQYSMFKHTHESMQNINIDGKKTLVENFCDNAGIHAVYDAYRTMQNASAKHEMKGLEQYSDEQLFFIGYAQNWCSSITPDGYKSRFSESAKHAPDDVRVVATLRNSNEFSAAWNCPVGSNMNPVSRDKCKIW